MTGLPGSGKSTISGVLLERLRSRGRQAFGLDGDELRLGLNQDLGFSDADRSENIRRTAEVARLMVDAGLVVVVSLISPFRSDRALVRSRFATDRFCEIFVDAPLQVCERRDPKGLYAKARRGELARMTGVDSPYEPPGSPDLHLHTDADDVGTCVERILAWLRGAGV
jgi:bifunctional enzyme CysN/CysC